jgi:hypothetical protein
VGCWHREQSAAEPLRGRTATSILLLSGLKRVPVDEPLEAVAAVRIVISSLARKQAAGENFTRMVKISDRTENMRAFRLLKGGC